MEILTTVITGITSATFGYLISLWKRRIRPWISPLVFSETRKFDDVVEISEELYKASRKSWFTENLPRKKGKLIEVWKVYELAENFLKRNNDSENRIKEGIYQLQSSKSDEEVAKALSFLLGHEGISEMLEYAVLRGEIIPNYGENVKPKIKYFLNENAKEGCFSFFIRGVTFNFGSYFNLQPYRKNILLPMVRLIASLEQEKLIDVFEKLKQYVSEQLEVHETIVEESKNIIESYSRWLCEFSITNFGDTPFIIFPDKAILRIEGRHIRPFELEGMVLTRTMDGNWSSIEGVLLVKPGTTENLAIVTKDIQRNIKGGDILRSVYKSGEANAFIKIQVLSSEIPFKRWIKSAPIKFRGK